MRNYELFRDVENEPNIVSSSKYVFIRWTTFKTALKSELKARKNSAPGTYVIKVWESRRADRANGISQNWKESLVEMREITINPELNNIHIEDLL